jgi:uncharacterized protein YjbI with pentapeptide repeats
MAIRAHVRLVKKGREAIRAWRVKNRELWLDEADLSGANLSGADLSGAALIKTDLRGADLTEANLSGANLSGANLKGADLKGTNLHEADLHKADLTEADLSGANLRKATLLNAYLSETKLNGAVLTEAVLMWARMAEAELRGADLSNANLVEASLLKAELSEANLNGTILNEADLSWADLSHADLTGAFLRGTDLYETDLRGAKLIGAKLTWAKFYGADLNGADLAQADCASTIFGNVDLSVVKGLETITHHSPSTLGVDTLYRSRGKISQEFLRGCGVPEDLTTYLVPLIVAKDGFLFHSCFISYSHKDEGFAKKLHARLRQEHVRVWFAPEDMKRGEKIHEQIDEAIGTFDKLLLVLSENSMESNWVKTEIYKARQREIKKNRRILFPIRLVDFDAIRNWKYEDADTGRDLAREIREYFIPDFSRWDQSDDFENAFAGLLRDLKAEATAEAKKNDRESP